MDVQFYKLPCRRKFRLLFFLIAIFIVGIVYYSHNKTTISTSFSVEIDTLFISPRVNLSQDVNVIDLREESKENYTCIKTKRLLHTVHTTICLHDSRDAVSNQIAKERIWEEKHLTKLLSFLRRYPPMNFIDVGANIGAYTMFVASFGRYVLAIECFKPNIDRIRKAVQIENLENNVTIIGNAIFSTSGHYLKLESNPSNVGSQAIIVTSSMNHSNDNDTYAVKTIQFDDVLPILQEKNIRNAVMKVDIQWSEMYLCLTGSKIFDSVNIPVVLMEWDVSAHGRYETHMRYIVKFFLARGYVATEDMCRVLNEQDALGSWPSDVYWMKMDRSQICSS